MATARDAQAGWGIYRASGYSFSLEEVNERLTSSGFNPVAPRTYQHYRKLRRYGYQRYVPINQLDVETLRDPVWGGPLQSRYRPRPAHVSVQLLVILGDNLLSLGGLVTQLSDVEATVQVDVSSFDVLSDSRLMEGSHALLVIGNRTKAVVIELVQPVADEQSGLEILCLFLGFVPTAEVAEISRLGPSHAIFSITSQEEGSPVVVLRSLYSLFEAIDSARVVCDEVLAVLGVADRYTFVPTRLNRLTFGSPVVADVVLAAPPLMVLVSLLVYLEYLRRKHYEADLVRGQSEILAEQARALRIRNDRAEFASMLDIKGLVAYIVEAVASTLPSEERQRAAELSPEELETVAELAERQLLPDAQSLFSPPTESVDVETDEQIPPLTEEQFETDEGQDQQN